jgi:hypothetical protein
LLATAHPSKNSKALALPLVALWILIYFKPSFISKELKMDCEDLSRTIAKEFAKELGEEVPAQVEAKLMRGEARGLVEAVTVAGFVVSLAQLAIQINETNKTPAELIGELQEKATLAFANLQEKTESAVRITNKTLHKIIERVANLLRWK